MKTAWPKPDHDVSAARLIGLARWFASARISCSEAPYMTAFMLMLVSIPERLPSR
jgi:hypothetical protein